MGTEQGHHGRSQTGVPQAAAGVVEPKAGALGLGGIDAEIGLHVLPVGHRDVGTQEEERVLGHRQRDIGAEAADNAVVTA
jgi:hypothetical protein